MKLLLDENHNKIFEEFIKTCKLPFIKNIKEAKEKEVPINIIGDYEYLEKSIEFCQKQGMEVLL